jgi:8-oxo-dGTP pyrophosphatase MutT (NUDIX family)
MIDIDSTLGDRLPFDIHTSYPPAEPGIKPSAVMVPLLKEDAVWKMLFTHRIDQLADHGGQVSFPGGRAEAGDFGPLQTALREAHEEIGVEVEDVRPMGILDPADTRTGFRIWPVVGVLKWPMGLKISPQEVREVFYIPVEWLMRPDRIDWQEMKSESGKDLRRIPFFEPFEGRVIWGATAAITLRLMDLLRGERAS